MASRPDPDTIDTLNILLVDNDSKRAAGLADVLDQSKYCVSYLPGSQVSLMREVDRLQPDIIIIDIESPDRDVLDSLAILSSLNPKPVVMFSEENNSQIIRQSVRSGVSAYVVGEISTTKIQTVLDAALARFEEVQTLKQELNDTRQQLLSRKTVDQAKRLLMERKGLSEQDAYQQIRKLAMDQGQRMDEVAKNIISLLTSLDL